MNYSWQYCDITQPTHTHTHSRILSLPAIKYCKGVPLQDINPSCTVNNHGCKMQLQGVRTEPPFIKLAWRKDHSYLQAVGWRWERLGPDVRKQAQEGDPSSRGWTHPLKKSMPIGLCNLISWRMLLWIPSLLPSSHLTRTMTFSQLLSTLTTCLLII